MDISKTKKQIRNNFRYAVFSRDKYRCVKCGFVSSPEKAKEELDAHHIMDRSIMAGGSVKENGATLCKKCHELAEEWHYSGEKLFKEGYHPNDIYKAIGSSFELACQKSKELGERQKSRGDI
jgi:5-methylcytosine-specific restriction endonuclease McrA